MADGSSTVSTSPPGAPAAGFARPLPTDVAKSEDQPTEVYGHRLRWDPRGSETRIMDKGFTTQVLPGDAWKQASRLEGPGRVRKPHVRSFHPRQAVGCKLFSVYLTPGQGSQPSPHLPRGSVIGNRPSRGHKLPCGGIRHRRAHPCSLLCAMSHSE